MLLSPRIPVILEYLEMTIMDAILGWSSSYTRFAFSRLLVPFHLSRPKSTLDVAGAPSMYHVF